MSWPDAVVLSAFFVSVAAVLIVLIWRLDL
jgi:hypothetical protein